jgi:hypothetical protein
MAQKLGELGDDLLLKAKDQNDRLELPAETIVISSA